MPRNLDANQNRRTERLSLRASSDQQDLIRAAAAARYKSVSEFVLESATAQAERILADRRWFPLSIEAWDEFQRLLDEPVSETPKLKTLLSRPSVFDD